LGLKRGLKLKKNIIVYGEREYGIQRRAIALLSEFLLDYTLEYPACYRCDEDFDATDKRIIFIGTRENNHYIDKFSRAKLTHAEEYRITVKDDTVYIEGADDAGVLYGCIDFFDKYILKCEYPHNDRYRVNCFEKRLPNFEFSSYPAVNNRGLWTWGHVMYDYRGYLDNMLKLKMNTLTIWNDNVPVNAREMIDYAHNNGIKVIWGYAWLWSTDCTEISLEDLCKYSESIFSKFEKEYSALCPDGIYFQSVTELGTDSLNGVVVAEAVTDFVNKTAALFFEKYPDIELQFGLHATSVKERLDYVKNTDPRIRIVWENCGSFPFSYIPTDVKDFDETKEFVKRIALLRGENEKFGVVIKGLTKLDWSTFEHPDAPRFIGVSSRELKDNRAERKRKIWRYLQAYWFTRADKALEMVQLMKKTKNGELYISALVEDGMFEEHIMHPVALFAEMLWNSDADIKELISEVALRNYVEFA